MDGMEVEASEYSGQDMTLSFDLSIIIVNYNVNKLLFKCLSSIFRTNSKKKMEVIVVDNASRDKSTETVKEDFPQVKLIQNRKNLGFARGANQGIKASRGRYIFFLNPDALIATGELDKMIDFMEENKEVGICGPRTLDPQRNIQYSCRRFPNYLTSISSSQSLLFKLFPRNPLSQEYLLTEKSHREEMEVDWVSGSALLARKDMLDQIGNLDENFFIYVEDVDLCYRAKKGGWKVFYYPYAEIRHLIGASTNQERSKMIIQHHKSMYHFYQKHYSAKAILSILVLWGIFLRMGIVLLSQLVELILQTNSKKEKV
jgi:GT2 family glycosyltransferase